MTKRPTKAELAAELAAAREQQSATREILGIISGSPTGVQRAFDAIATALCEADLAGVLRRGRSRPPGWDSRSRASSSSCTAGGSG